MKHHMVLVLELLAFTAVSSSVVVVAGQDELVFDTVYTSTRKVTCISVGEQSVWVGTEGGCLRWDPKVPAGAKYTAMDGLPANHVVGIAPGPDPQTVIIATAEGIKAFLDRRGKLTPVPDFSPQVGRASALASASGEVYVAVGRQVHVLQPLAVGFRWVPAGPELAAEARSLTHFEGVAWAGTGNGLFRLDAQRWEPVIHSEDPLAAQINALLPTNGDLCVGTVGGLFRMRAGRWRQFTTADGLPDNHVTALFADGDRIIVGTYGGGVAALRADAIEPIAGAPAYVTALDVCQISGAIWLGTEQEGTWLCERGNWSRQLARAEPPGHNITALAASEGEILVGTFEQGVGVLRDNAWRAFGTVHGLGSEWINHIAYGHNRVWARTSAGDLFTYRAGTWRQATSRDGLLKDWTSSVQAAGGDVWVGTWGAASRFDGSKWHNLAPKPALEGQVVTSAAVIGNDIWLGTAKGGLCHYDARAGAWRTHTLGSGLTDTWVTCLDVWRGCLWVGTFSGGLCKYDRGTWEYFRAADVLPGDRINCITHGDCLYVGTLDGLCRYDGRNWQSYGRAEGLPSEVVQALAISGPYLWVGTPEGLARARLRATQ